MHLTQYNSLSSVGLGGKSGGSLKMSKKDSIELGRSIAKMLRGVPLETARAALRIGTALVSEAFDSKPTAVSSRSSGGAH